MFQGNLCIVTIGETDLNLPQEKLSLRIASWKIDGETLETMAHIFGGKEGAPKSLQMMTAAMKLKNAYSLEGKL